MHVFGDDPTVLGGFVAHVLGPEAPRHIERAIRGGGRRGAP